MLPVLSVCNMMEVNKALIYLHTNMAIARYQFFNNGIII